MTALFALTLFASAALVFTLEPMFGKMVLAPLGGAPAVWNTCVVFYQAVLLGGYAYAHVLAAHRVKIQVIAQAGLLAAAAFVLPVALPASWPAPDGSPTAWLLGALVAGPGLPLLALFATAPLLQRWIATTSAPAARDPYFLYAASNAGSLGGLLAYPLLVEPESSLSVQRWAWAIGYGALSASVVACGAWACRRPGGQTSGVAADGAPSVEAHERREQDIGPARAATPRGQRLRWLALAAVPSSLLLSVTTYLSTDVAPVPLLWAVPLALYLLSFVLAFASRRVISNVVLRESMIVFTLLVGLTLLLEVTRPAWLLAPLHLIGLLVFALALHTALAESRPSPARLTEFYFWVAAGGVVGGLFNTLVAPLVFDSVAEYPAAIAAACLLRPLWKPAPILPRQVDWGLALALGALTLLLVLALRDRIDVPAAAILALAVGATLVFVLCTTNAARFSAAVALFLTAGSAASVSGESTLLQAERTFFGIYYVMAEGEPAQHALAHGTTLHGAQLVGREDEPTLYYHRVGPIGQAFEALRPRLGDAHIGVVGLGAGGLAAYVRPGERWTFYEIDPAVERIARNPRYFTYLERCAEACAVVLGDARLSIAAAVARRYRLLILDAFSSDAIPTHLLTREAFALYFDRLEEEGVVAFHVSNRHLNLSPLIGALAAERGYAAIAQSFHADPSDPAQRDSDWVLVARTRDTLAPLAGDGRWSALDAQTPMRVWTDDFSDILGVLRR
jgi:hypothetical protein